MLSRRQITSGALSAAAATLGGCASWVGPATYFCPDDPRISDPTTPLTIDVHAHVFNGTDIPVAPFITYVHKIPVLGEILQKFGWEVVPTGAQEMAVLHEISQQISAGCGPHTLAQMFVAHRNYQHRRSVHELKATLRALEKNQRARFLTAQGKAVSDAIHNLSEDYDENRKNQKLIAAGTPDAVVNFVLRQFQYRYVNVFDFLMEYSTGPSRKIDLMICHFLDFDWPLGMGHQTPTSLSDQIAVMEKISILTGGRVHYYVPFDPMKQVAYDVLHRATESPMDLVQNAISRGCVGVKIYPPMGFAPSGNAGVQRARPNFWHRTWLPDTIKQDSKFGQHLDDALRTLFSWCITNDVPIMAHTSRSEGPSDAFESLTEAKYWHDVPTGLRVNFGHFGNTEIPKDDKDTSAYVALMADQQRANLYADSAYFSHSMDNPKDLTRKLGDLLKANKGLLAQRFMYGSDWEMLIIEGTASKNYLNIFERIFKNLDQAHIPGARGKLSTQFFGFNAANYLSLQANSVPRRRLDAFYSTRGIPTPHWVTKVDHPASNSHMRVSQVRD
jgi:hypothetical protein